MKLFDTVNLFPGTPDAWTHPNGLGVQLRYPSTLEPDSPFVVGPGTPRPPAASLRKMYFTSGVEFVGSIKANEGIFHLIVQMRADVPGWDSGYYIGHGPIIGPVFQTYACGKLESWAPSFNPSGPGGNQMLPGTLSPEVFDGKRYELAATSERGQRGRNTLQYVLQGGPLPWLYDSNRVPDKNPDIDMSSTALLIAVHFAPLPGKDSGIVRLTNGKVEHY